MDQPKWKSATRDMNYLQGFESYFTSEAIPGALPKGQNAPMKCPMGLYAEQFSGTAFTRPRRENFRSWFYRILPTVSEGAPTHYPHPKLDQLQQPPKFTSPEQYRWLPLPPETKPVDFVDGLFPIVTNGTVGVSGCTIYHYQATASMNQKFFSSSDGELLLIPESAALELTTECGILCVDKGDIAVIPRGMKFKVDLIDSSSSSSAKGYLCENYGSAFQLPNLGPIGANGLANHRDFEYPVAKYDDSKGEFSHIAKFDNQLWKYEMDHSPCNVVAWHGNLAPYRYDLTKFNTINTVSYDHPDPSIFTVLTSPGGRDGEANLDFVIFPERWMVAENTFRPPYYHRNFMNEYMGLIHGVYDAKEEGFLPGGASLHNCMAAHGPDKDTFAGASNAQSKPKYQKDTLAFMLESNLVFRPTQSALNADFRDKEYMNCWKGLESNFKP